MEEKFLAGIKEALEIEGVVQLNDSFRDYPEWDSLSRLSLIAFLDSEYGVQIENEKFEKMKSWQDVVAFVKEKQKA